MKQDSLRFLRTNSTLLLFMLLALAASKFAFAGKVAIKDDSPATGSPLAIDGGTARIEATQSEL